MCDVLEKRLRGSEGPIPPSFPFGKGRSSLVEEEDARGDLPLDHICKQAANSLLGVKKGVQLSNVLERKNL